VTSCNTPTPESPQNERVIVGHSGVILGELVCSAGISSVALNSHWLSSRLKQHLQIVMSLSAARKTVLNMCRHNKFAIHHYNLSLLFNLIVAMFLGSFHIPAPARFLKAQLHQRTFPGLSRYFQHCRIKVNVTLCACVEEERCHHQTPRKNHRWRQQYRVRWNASPCVNCTAKRVSPFLLSLHCRYVSSHKRGYLGFCLIHTRTVPSASHWYSIKGSYKEVASSHKKVSNWSNGPAKTTTSWPFSNLVQHPLR